MLVPTLDPSVLDRLRSGDVAGALPVLLAWLEEADPPPATCASLGEALGRLGQFRAAIPFLEKALSADPEREAVALQLGRAYHQEGDSEKAARVLEAVVARHPDQAEAHHVLTGVHWAMGDPGRAWEHAQEAAARAWAHPEVFGNYLQLLRHVKGAQAADRVLQHRLTWEDPRPLEARRAELLGLATPPLPPSLLPQKERQVVFVAEEPRVRQAKMAWALREAGWETVLLCQKHPGAGAEACYDRVLRFRTPYEALEKARSFHPRTFHLSAVCADETTTFLVQNRPGTLVYDCWDQLEGLFAHGHLLGRQRFCMANADGLCCRDLRARRAGGRVDAPRRGKRILFHDGCWDRPELRGDVPRRTDGIHVVSCGFIGSDTGERDLSYVRVARACVAEGVHLHLYPHPSQFPFTEAMRSYLELQRATPYLHLHEPVPMERVVPELSQYHFGISVMDPLVWGGTVHGYSEAYLKHCGSARIIEFLDAGLPVILNRELGFQYRMLDRFGLAIDARSLFAAPLRARLEALLAEDLEGRAAAARSALSIRAQIPRLIAFYESL